MRIAVHAPKSATRLRAGIPAVARAAALEGHVGGADRQDRLAVERARGGPAGTQTVSIRGRRRQQRPAELLRERRRRAAGGRGHLSRRMRWREPYARRGTPAIAGRRIGADQPDRRDTGGRGVRRRAGRPLPAPLRGAHVTQAVRRECGRHRDRQHRARLGIPVRPLCPRGGERHDKPSAAWHRLRRHVQRERRESAAPAHRRLPAHRRSRQIHATLRSPKARTASRSAAGSAGVRCRWVAMPQC